MWVGNENKDIDDENHDNEDKNDRMAKSSIWNGKLPASITIDKNHTFNLYKHHNAIYSGKHQNECIQVAELPYFVSSEPTSLASITPSIWS